MAASRAAGSCALHLHRCTLHRCTRGRAPHRRRRSCDAAPLAVGSPQLQRPWANTRARPRPHWRRLACSRRLPPERAAAAVRCRCVRCGRSGRCRHVGGRIESDASSTPQGLMLLLLLLLLLFAATRAEAIGRTALQADPGGGDADAAASATCSTCACLRSSATLRQARRPASEHQAAVEPKPLLLRHQPAPSAPREHLPPFSRQA